MLLSSRHIRFYKVSHLILLVAAVWLIHPAYSIQKEDEFNKYNDDKYAAKNNHVYIETLKHDYKVSTDNSKFGSDSVERDAMKNLYQKAKQKGNVGWVTSFGSLGDDSVQAILPDDSGRIYLAGVFVGDLSIEGLPTVTSNGGYDFFVLTVAANGTMESIFSFGGDGDDWANSMDWSPDGNIIVVGKFNGTWNAGVDIITSGYNSTFSDIFVLKITPTGQAVWVLQVGGPADDNANDVSVIQDTGDIIVVGSFQQYIDFGAIGSYAYAVGSDDMLILWVHPDGYVTTYKAYGSYGPDSAMGVALSVTLGQIGICAAYSGYIEMEGGHHSATDTDVLIILYWNNATYIDSTSFGSGVDDGFEDVVVDSAGNVYVAGYYTDGAVSSNGGRDIVVIKFTEKAAFLWYKLFGGPNDDMAYGIGVDDDGNVFIVGSTGGDIDFGSGTIPSDGSSDIFSLKLDPEGNLLEAITWGGSYNDTGREVAIVNGSPIIAGTFVNSIEFGSTEMESKGATDMVLFQVAGDGSGHDGDKGNIAAITAGVIVPVVVLSVAGVVAFVFIKRKQTYRKNVLAVARASEIHLPATPEANYQPVVVSSENMSNQSLNFSLASHNSSNQSFRDPNSNYSALNGSTSMEHPYETFKGGMTAELSEVIKAQGLGEWSNSTWLIDFRQIQIQQKIGSGAFGAVFRAIWRGVPVAVKQSNTELAIQDFISEAEILTKLRPHPNITQFLGVCPSPFCLVFEFVPNGSLFSFLMNKSKEMDINLKIRILRGVVAGMIHLHSEGIVHRDLAARNILLDGTFTPKVCDFGLSRATGGATMGHTASEIGPIKWMAPEAILKRIYSPKTDIWSFGVVIFEVLERQVPYPDLSVPQVAAYITQISLLQSLSENHTHPEGLIQMMETCLQLDPEKRPTFEDLIQQFDEKFGQQH